MSAPSQGDIAFVDLSPTVGHEQSGHRPVLVVSNSEFNQYSGLVWVIPITSRVKNRPQEVALPEGLKVSGVLCLEHIKSLDFRARNLRVLDRAPTDFLYDVIGRIQSVLI